MYDESRGDYVVKKGLCWLLCLLMVLIIASTSCLSVSADSADATEFTADDKDEVAYTGAGTGFNYDGEFLEVPQIRVTTDDGNGVSLLKSDGYVGANISITDTDGSVLSDACTIKVRGNTTAIDSIPKKAYAFKFSKKKDVLGMGKGKKWVLLANCYDPSLLRNYAAIDLARELGLDYTSEQKFVELWLDGSYRGCYALYEQIQQGKDRVDIDIESNGGKKDFLVEYEDTPVDEDTRYFTVEGMRFAVKEPDDTTDEQLEYVSETMTDIVSVLKTGDKEQIESVLDIPSFTKYYLLNEYMKTMDFGNTSVYYYYKDGKLYAGPAWDFDKSSGSTDPTIGSVRAKNTYKTDGIMQDQQTLYKYIGRKGWFVSEVKQVYEDHYDYIKNISADNGLLDSWREEYRSLFDRNFTVWNVARKWTNYQLTPKATYEENYQYLKDWCTERNQWLAEHFDLFSYEYVKGDADGNGSVEIVDATAVQRVLAFVQSDDDGLITVRASVSDEEELSVIDVTAVQRYLADMGNPYELDTAAKTRLREL